MHNILWISGENKIFVLASFFVQETITVVHAASQRTRKSTKERVGAKNKNIFLEEKRWHKTTDFFYVTLSDFPVKQSAFRMNKISLAHSRGNLQRRTELSKLAIFFDFFCKLQNFIICTCSGIFFSPGFLFSTPASRQYSTQAFHLFFVVIMWPLKRKGAFPRKRDFSK